MKLLVLGFFFVMVLADVKLESHIFKGQEAKDGQFPYQVGLLLKYQKAYFICSGSLISQTWIVSAAQCLDIYSTEHITAFLGSVYHFQGTQRPARNKIIHPGFNASNLTGGNDIGLIEIDSVSYSDTIKSIDLPPLSDQNLDYEGHIAVTSGWGRIDSNSLANILQYTHLLVISNAPCSRAYLEDIAEKIICVGDPDGSSTCKGDSGGPLVDMGSKHLIGINSFGPEIPCGIIQFANAFTRVTSFRQWIYDNTGI